MPTFSLLMTQMEKGMESKTYGVRHTGRKRPFGSPRHAFDPSALHQCACISVASYYASPSCFWSSYLLPYYTYGAVKVQ